MSKLFLTETFPPRESSAVTLTQIISLINFLFAAAVTDSVEVDLSKSRNDGSSVPSEEDTE